MDQGKPRVLIVRPSTGQEYRLISTLQAAGYEVQVAEPGAEGLRLLDREPPDVTLVDLVDEPDAGSRFISEARQRGGAEREIIGVADAGPGSTVAPDAVRAGADSIVEVSSASTMLVPMVERASERARSMVRAEHFRRRAEETLSLARFDGIIG